MLKTRIPYDIEKIEEIRDRGAIVDVSSPDFPGIEKEKQLRTTLVFLRNTGFDVELNFSSCTYEEKRDYLLLYLQEKIEIKNKEFSDTWVNILMEYIGIECNRPCFLNREELSTFVSENREYISHVVNFIYSLGLYAMKRYSLEDKAYDFNDFETSDLDDISNNICEIIKAPEIIMIYSIDSSPVFYNKAFTIDNNKLFDAIQHLPFMSLLFGLGKYELFKKET